jgi:hypothetical protein
MILQGEILLVGIKRHHQKSNIRIFCRENFLP